MDQNRRDMLENLFYNMMMNANSEILSFQDNRVFSNYNTGYNASYDNEIINESLYDVNPNKMVISEEEKNKLLTIKYKDVVNKQQNAVCFITQDEFQEENDVIQLPCNHYFTPDSIMQWLTEESAECPVCRYKFESVEKKVVICSNNNSLNLEQDLEDDIPDLTPISNVYNNYNYSIIGAIDNANEINSFTNILLTNIFNSFDETNSNDYYNVIEEVD